MLTKKIDQIKQLCDHCEVSYAIHTESTSHCVFIIQQPVYQHGNATSPPFYFLLAHKTEAGEVTGQSSPKYESNCPFPFSEFC